MVVPQFGLGTDLRQIDFGSLESVGPGKDEACGTSYGAQQAYIADVGSLVGRQFRDSTSEALGSSGILGKMRGSSMPV